MKKKINYNDIINKLDEYLKNKRDLFLLIVVHPTESGYKIQESNGITPKEFYISTNKDLDKYIKDKNENSNCKIIHFNVLY